MSVLRVSQMGLRLFGVLALILGFLVWFGDFPGGLVPIHMLVGTLTVIAAIVVGGVAFQSPVSRGIGVVTIVVALAQLVLGLSQTSLVASGYFILIQVLHLVLGVAVLGVGEAAAARYGRWQAGAAA